MSIRRSKGRIAGIFLLGAFFFATVFSRAVTVEVEDDEEDIPATPVATPVVIHPKSTQAQGPSSFSPAPNESWKARVRISDSIGFYYFVRSGFVVRDVDQVPFIGRVVGAFDPIEHTFSTPNKFYIELTSSKTDIKPGDLLVVFRVNEPVAEPHSSFSGFWVQNSGIVKVLEVGQKRCQVEVKEAFFPIAEGDKVRFYDDEIGRWKQAQIKKSLPDHPVKCFVAGGGFGESKFNQADWIMLTAGSRKGVVEGQRFQLREYRDTGFSQPILQTFQGEARVFYAGEDSSMAQIIFNHVPVEKSFEAVYQP